MQPQTKYAQSGDVSIAYQVSGAGPIDIVFAPGFISHLEHMWEEPRWARFQHGLGAFARLISFDKRGTGLSDRSVGFPHMDERIDDIRAVMDAAGSERAVLLGISEGGAMSALFAATYPERVSGLILIGAYANALAAVPGFANIDALQDEVRRSWGTGAMLPRFAPGLAQDPQFVQWWARFERLGGSPSAVLQLWRNNREIDITPALSSIQVPTLMIHRTGDVRIRVEAARHMAAAIPNARLIELPGTDHMPWLDDTNTVLNEIRNYVGASLTKVEPERVLATVLFTDVVDSTRRAQELGDAQWRGLMDTHYALARGAIDRFRGRQVKTLGDGLLATFDGPARAVRCAQAIARDVQPLGIAVRAGLHTGEITLVDSGDVSGIAVNIAARISSAAGASEVLVSSTVKDLVAGAGLVFADAGSRRLRVWIRRFGCIGRRLSFATNFANPGPLSKHAPACDTLRGQQATRLRSSGMTTGKYPRDLRGYGRSTPDPKWPGGARIAVQFVVNYEEGGENCVLHGDAASEAFLSEIVGAQAWPGQRHMNMESIYEYGARAGFWRLWRAFTARRLPVTVYGVAHAMMRSPEQVAAMREANWEIATHGLKWIDYKDFKETEERAHILEAIRLHTEVAGSRPLGFYQGRCSEHTLGIVMAEGGFEYASDSYADDLPYWVSGPRGPFLIVPYTLDANDMRFATPQGFNAGEQFYTYLKDTFDVLYREGADAPKMMSVGLHCRLAGRPGRTAALERFLDYVASHDRVWIPTRLDIARHWRAQHPAKSGNQR